MLEIGFGMGETTAAIAAAHPQIDYLGIEVHTPGVGSLLNRIEALGLANVRIIQHDAVEVLERMITPAALGPQYFREAAEVINAAAGGPPDRARMAEIMRRHGLTPAPPPTMA